MKRFINILTIIWIGFCAIGCDKDDAFSSKIEVFDPPTFDVSSANGKKFKEMYDKYTIIFKSDFAVKDLRWNWDDTLRFNISPITGYTFTKADPAYIIPVIDSVESWVLKVFPLDFMKKNAPLNVYLADTLANKLAGTSPGSTAPFVARIFEGFIARNYTAISYVSPRFDVEKNKRMLREAWLSLFIEKMLVNWPSIKDFATVSEEAYNKSTYTATEDIVTTYGVLKHSRLKQSGGSATSSWNSTKPVQDFGDYVAFIVYTPESEKQTIYAKNARIQRKVNLVKAYFKDNFKIELPYRPISN